MTNRKFTHPDDAPEGHRWQTVGGDEVTQLTTFNLGSGDDRLAGVVGGHTLTSWYCDGSYYINEENDFDICDVPVERTAWINIYQNHISDLHTTRDDADYSAASNRVACVKVTYKEGQFDD